MQCFIHIFIHPRWSTHPYLRDGLLIPAQNLINIVNVPSSSYITLYFATDTLMILEVFAALHLDEAGKAIAQFITDYFIVRRERNEKDEAEILKLWDLFVFVRR